MNNNNTFYILHLNIFTALFDNDVFAKKKILKNIIDSCNSVFVTLIQKDILKQKKGVSVES